MSACIPADLPDEPFVAALEHAHDLASALREAICAALSLPPPDEAQWLALMADPRVQALFGETLILCDTNGHWIRQALGGIVSTLVSNGKTAEAEHFADGAADGMTNAAVSCPCGKCELCVGRDTFGEAEVRARLRPQLRAGIAFKTPKSRIVDRNGQHFQS